MNKKYVELLVHIAIWLVVFLSPLMFINHGRGITSGQFLMMAVAPVAVMVVFYMNYLWLAPRYFAVGHYRFYLAVNIAVVVVLGIGIHEWVTYLMHTYEPNRTYQADKWASLGFILRDIFNLTIAAAIATAIVLAMRWQKAETARQEAEAARVTAELNNLRSQINPHFLLNTLNNIYALTAFDPTKAQEAIQELSRMLRHILYDYQQPTVPLTDELEFIENYVKLMRLRLPQSVDVTLNSSLSTLKTHTVAPMLFISLVENAFKHGISPTEPSFIHILIEADRQHITCDISNSNHPKTASDRSGHGIGLQQVQRRLELAYPNHYTWEKGVTDDGKTYHSKITITL